MVRSKMSAIVMSFICACMAPCVSFSVFLIYFLFLFLNLSSKYGIMIEFWASSVTSQTVACLCV